MKSKTWIFGVSVGILLGLTTFLLAFKITTLKSKFQVTRPMDPPVQVKTGEVKENDNIQKILIRENLPPPLISQIEKTLGKALKLNKEIRPGHLYNITTSTNGVFQKFVYHPDAVHDFTITRSSENVVQLSQNIKTTEWREKRVSLDVKEFIHKDLMNQGFDEKFINNFTTDLSDNIFGWHIDFFTEQRPGDHLEVLLEQEFLVGSETPLWSGRGRVLVASYEGKSTRQKSNVALRYLASGAKSPGYYDFVGNAVQREFLRAPFTQGAFRISSGFNPKRFHPILRTYTPHHGIDYAAAVGTAVAAIGKGTVIFTGWKGGFGKAIEIQHRNKRYVSRYGHLSKIAVKVGEAVDQGRYIGNVGSTGLSTGPHLHFELMVNGQKTNFLKMSFPPATKLADKDILDFKKFRDLLLARLNTTDSPTTLASK